MERRFRLIKPGKRWEAELSALGYQPLLGPSLDVVDGFFHEGSQDLGTRTFGGDPLLGQSHGTGLYYGPPFRKYNREAAATPAGSR